MISYNFFYAGICNVKKDFVRIQKQNFRFYLSGKKILPFCL